MIRGLALVYHRVAERAGDRERELLPALDLASFRVQLDWLGRRFRLVTASELLRAAHQREAREPVPLALTFDDDLASHAGIMLEELTRRGAPATFFLGGTGLGGGAERPWWELLEAAAARHPDEALVGRTLPEAAAALEALHPAERAVASGRLRELAGPDAGSAPLDETGIRRIAAAGMEIGFHPLAHDRLTDLHGPALEEALRNGRDRLAEIAGGPLLSISYPHGAADATVLKAAARAGYRFGFTTDDIALGAGHDPLAIPRIYPRRRRARLWLQLRAALRGAQPR